MRLLIVEDDKMIGEGLQEGLKAEGYAVDWVRDGQDAELALSTQTYNLIVLDLGLPKKNGLDVLAQYRRSGGAAPVLVLTARDSTHDRVTGLDGGADDYLVKPFDLDEVAARIRALLRRSTGRVQTEIEHRELVLNPATHEARLMGKTLELTAREFSVLHALLDPPGKVVSRSALEEQLYGWNEEVESNAVEVYIHYLRKKLGPDFIKNVRGVGYKVADKA
jgi:two-component system, OmpR family, response regulator QseB